MSHKDQGNSGRCSYNTQTTLFCWRGSREVEMDPVSPRRAQKRTHSLMNLHLEIIVRGIFAID